MIIKCQYHDKCRHSFAVSLKKTRRPVYFLTRFWSVIFLFNFLGDFWKCRIWVHSASRALLRWGTDVKTESPERSQWFPVYPKGVGWGQGRWVPSAQPCLTCWNRLKPVGASAYKDIPCPLFVAVVYYCVIVHLWSILTPGHVDLFVWTKL